MKESPFARMVGAAGLGAFAIGTVLCALVMSSRRRLDAWLWSYERVGRIDLASERASVLLYVDAGGDGAD